MELPQNLVEFCKSNNLEVKVVSEKPDSSVVAIETEAERDNIRLHLAKRGDTQKLDIYTVEIDGQFFDEEDYPAEMQQVILLGLKERVRIKKSKLPFFESRPYLEDVRSNKIYWARI